MVDRTVALQALASGLVQPDQTTCGSCVLVAARMLDDPAYAGSLVDGPSATVKGAPIGTLQDRFRQQALAMHRLTSGFRNSGGGWQLPWPTALGTQPWALAQEMTSQAGEKGLRYVVRPVLPHQRPALFSRIATFAGAGHAVPLYVGSHWSPRHVVLVLPGPPPTAGGVPIYDPASGRCYPIEEPDFTAGRLDVAGWPVPWVVVVPDDD